LSTSIGTVAHARNKAWRYWNSDGLFMMVQGVAIVLFGVSMLWSHHQRSILLPGLTYFASMGIQADQIFTKKIVGWLKTRIIYPRTGYVALPGYKELMSSASLKQKRQQKWMLVWITFLIVLGSYVVIAHVQWYLAGAQIMTAGLLWLFWTKGKFAWYVPAPLVVGTLFLVLLPASSKDRLEIILIEMGAQHMVLGVSILLQYLREHPVPPA
jgi:hypothetical protein